MLLILQRYRAYGYRPAPALLAVVIGCAGAFLAVLGVLILGLAWADVNPATYTYQVTVTGLENYTGGPVTDILVPLPLREGEMIFSEEDLEGQRWRLEDSLCRDTEGKDACLPDHGARSLGYQRDLWESGGEFTSSSTI